MRLILSQYLRSLKERDEFDLLLPDLLLTMGYVTLARPQTGTREYGVDLALVGKSPDDQVEELLLFVIKRGDLGRSDWDSGPTSVRQSLNDIFDIYVKTHIEPAHASLRMKIILATTGNLKRDVQLNWNGYIEENSSKAKFDFWGGDKVAVLMEEFMLDEHIFSSDDRRLLRKSLALSADGDYDQSHLHTLYLNQLGLEHDGSLKEKVQKPREIIKALRIVNLSAQVFSRWAEDEGNIKQGLIATERAILWSWHRINLESPDNIKKYYKEVPYFIRSYDSVSRRYYSKIEKHLFVRDALSGWTRESSELSMVVFEQIGILSIIALSQILFTKSDNDEIKTAINNATIVADGLINLIDNNPISSSPVLDGHVIDITLALTLLVTVGKEDEAKKWVNDLIFRIDFAFRSKHSFPISTDSLDDLVDFNVSENEESVAHLKNMSWLLPTLAGWAVLLDCNDSYKYLSENSKEDYPDVCQQLWHPTKELSENLYFSAAQYCNGETQAPIILPDDPKDYLHQMQKFIDTSRYEVFTISPALKAGIFILDLMACRHFRTPVPANFWYQLGKLKKTPVETNN